MNKELLKQIIIENQEFVREVKSFPRDIYFEKSGNYVLTGPRRAGKTFAMFRKIQHLISEGTPPNSILYINFEDERLMEMKAPDLNQLLDAYHELYDQTPLLFFDEIQNIEGWEKFARRLADQGFRIFITGSNATMLSREIATTLGGRFIVKEIFPLSFAEYLIANGITLDKNWAYSSQRFEIRKQFENYFRYGGLPEIMQFHDKQLWLRSLYNKIFFGDIITRYAIRNDHALKLMVKKLAESTHDEVSFNRIRHIIQSAGIKIGTATLIEYVGYLEESFLIARIRNILSKSVQKESAGKFYFFDNGILSLFLMNAETILLENLVASHLLRKYREGIFYLRKNHEVDFYIPEAKTFVQACYAFPRPETEQREIQAMMNMSGLVNVEEMLVITLEVEKEVNVNDRTIRFIPAWKWLLEEA